MMFLETGVEESSSPLAGVYLPRDDDLGSSDEVKVFKDEGEDDLEGLDGFNASFSEELQAALLEDKSLLIQETENLSIKDELLALEPPPGVPAPRARTRSRLRPHPR